MTNLQENLIEGALRLQPEEMMTALSQGANPFRCNEFGASGFSSFLENSKELRQMHGKALSQSDPSSLVGRMNNVFEAMLSKPVPLQDQEHFATIVKETFQANALQEQVLDLLQQKASNEGKSLSSQTTSYFSNKIAAGNALFSSLASSQAFNSLEPDCRDKLQGALNQPPFTDYLAQEEVALYDVDSNGMVSVKAQVSMPPPISKTSVERFRANNTELSPQISPSFTPK